MTAHRSSAERAVAAARGWVGTPYRDQASCRGAGADCLGLLRGVWREVYGREPAEVPPYGPDWAEVSGRETLLEAARALMAEVPAAELRPGDVLVFRMRARAVAKHVGLVGGAAGALTLIHAYSGRGVVEQVLSFPWRVRIAAAFRLPEATGGR